MEMLGKPINTTDEALGGYVNRDSEDIEANMPKDVEADMPEDVKADMPDDVELDDSEVGISVTECELSSLV